MMDDIVQRRQPNDRLDVAVDGQFAGTLTPSLRHEFWGWTVLPLASLGLAGALALLIALMRVPGADALFGASAQSFFDRALVVHVVFAFVAWYLGVHGALTVLVTAKDLKQSNLDLAGWGVVFGRVGLYAAAAGLLSMLVPVAVGSGIASANNYIPVLHDPFFYAGLSLVAAGLLLPIVRLLLLIRAHRTVEPLTFGVAAAGAIFVVALLCVGCAWTLRPDLDGLEAVADFVLWGGGHVLQFANTALMLSALFLIAHITLGETPVSARTFKIAMFLLVAGAAAGPLLYVTHEPGDPAQREMFTNLYWFALPIPTGVVLVGLLALLIRRRADFRSGAPELAGLSVAWFLFSYGGVLGFFEGSVDTRTPGHYHAELIAVTIAFMALYFALFLPVLGRRTERRRLRTLMYVLLGTGQFIHSSALYLAGVFGVARKTVGAAQGLEAGEKVFSMAVMGVGGLIAVIGGILFVVLSGRMLFARAPSGPVGASHPVRTPG
jgi:hypothetical protein